MNQHLSVGRLGLLLRADLMLRARTVLIVAATLAGLIVLHGQFTVYVGDARGNIYPFWFYGTLFAWGAIAASYSFPELHDKSRNQAYLLVPASALEKTLSRLIIVTILFLPFVPILLTVVSWINGGLSFVLFGERVPLFRAGDYLRGEVLAQAVVVQSVFFLGAAWFRRAHFVKTAFAVTAISIGLSLVVGAILWLIYRDVAWGPGMDMSESDVYLNHRWVFDTTGTVAPILYYFILPPFCWWVAWLRVKETQVSYGV